MNFNKVILPQDIYALHLETVNEVKFTRREIDIIAYLFSGKSAKTIASCLSISPKTIETHMRNITMKIECNSRDGIINFIEKSDKLSLLKEYYLSLLTRATFEKHLLTVAKLPDFEVSDCVLITWGEEDQAFLVRYIDNHLKLAGLKTRIETREKRTFVHDLENHRESSKNQFVIFIVPEMMLQTIKKEDDVKKEELFLLIERVDQSSNCIIALLSESHVERDNCQGLADLVSPLKQENYYHFFFDLLKKILPRLDLDKAFLDFKKLAEPLYDFSKAENKKILQNDLPLIKQSYLDHKILQFMSLFQFIKIKKYQFFVGSVLGMSVFCILFVIKKQESLTDIQRYQENIAVNADLKIPTKSILLNRAQLMTKIEKNLEGSNEIQTVALVGIGGAGKTTVVRQYARQQNATVVWEFNAESKESRNDSFESLAEALSKTDEEKIKFREVQNIKNTEERENKIILFVRDKLKHFSNWFLIYENVERFTDIQKYFPHDPKVWGKGKVIVITRDNNIGNNNLIDRTIQVGELIPEEKLALFTSIMNNGSSSQLNSSQSEQIIEFLNNIPPFPLDVSIAAYYLKATNVPYRAYLEKLTQYDKDFERVQQNLLEEASSYTKTRYGIITLSLQNIINSHKDFRDLLLFISLIDSRNIPRDLLDKYKASTVVDNFIYNLKKHSLVTSEAALSSGSTQNFSIHRSTQAIALTYLTKLLNSEKNKHFIEPIGTAFKNYVAEVIDKEDFTKMNLLLRHGEIFVSHSNLLTDLTLASIGGELGSIYRNLGNYEKAKQLFEQSIALYKKNSYENHFWFAHALGRLGCVYSDEGDYENAKQLLEQCILIHRKNSHNNNPWFARTLGWLGNVYREQGDYKKAKKLFEESLVIYKKNSYENHPWFAQALERLGGIYREQCDYEEAKKLLKASLVIYKKNSYENNPWFARALAWLGNIYKDQGNYEKAKQLFEQSLGIYRKNSHENHPWFAWTLVWLGNVYKDQGDYEKAKQLFEQSLGIYRKNYFEGHPWFALALARLGGLYREQGDYEKATQLFEESLMVYKNNAYENHPWFARTLEHLGNVYKDQGNYEKAKQLFEQSLRIYKENYFENHPWFALALARLGNVYKDQENYETAKNLLESSLQAYEKTCGKDHIDIAPVIMSLGQIYMLENDMHTAEKLMNKALKIFQIKKHAESYICLESLSDLYLVRAAQLINRDDTRQSENFKKQAIDYLEQAREVIKTHFPKDSPHGVRIEAKLKNLSSIT